MSPAEDYLWQLIETQPELTNKLQMLFELAWHDGFTAAVAEGKQNGK